TGKPILSSSSGLINLAPADPRQAEYGLGTGTNLQSTWDIALQHGDHLNNPRDFQKYWEDKMEPYVMKFMADRGVGSHHYIDGTIGCMNPDRYGIYYTGELDGNNNNIPDGTGIPSGGNEGAMFDPAHMFNALPLKPCLSALVESRSSGIQAYPKRVYSQYSGGEAMIAFTAENAAEVKKFVGDMRDKITERGKAAYANSTDPEDTVYNLMKMVKRTVTNEDWIIPSGDKVALPTAFWNTRGAKPMVYRTRPTAYILPSDVPMNFDVSKRLVFNGAQVDVLTQDTIVEVEVFGDALPMASKRYHDSARRIVIAPTDAQMENANYVRASDLVQWSPNFWIQDQPNTLPVQTVTVPKGSFVIYMSQPTARMIATVMEPDAERSYTRWSLARQIQAGDARGVSVPYRYMKETRLPTKPLFMAWPQATGAGMMEVEPLSGTEFDKLVTTYFNGNKIEKVLLAETLYAKVDSTIKMGFSFLSREELRNDMPKADFFFWNYKTEQYDNIKRNADGTVFVGEDYCGPHGEYGIQPIKFVAAITEDSLIGKIIGDDGGCNAGFALFAILMLAPFIRRKG
ncbi:MAG: SYNERG-CTERM sorting domain-containing protein, partial [Synergistaceae bacterium]|nr:SYNERG-CTERM sorting domain-containing protein [Synergistaceae bacterium]